MRVPTANSGLPERSAENWARAHVVSMTKIAAVRKPHGSGKPEDGQGLVWVLMTNRCYFQFDTRRRLRRFFTSSEGWSSLNKR